MKVSLTGMARNTCRALQSSKEDMACSLAFSLSEMIDNLRLVRDGEASVEEFFKLYVFDEKDKQSLADQVDPKLYDCMQVDPEDVDVD